MPTDTQSIGILLIEDDEEDFILLQKVLAKVSSTRYKVQWEQHAGEGLAHMLREDHDICLIDYRLGANSGIELLKEARRRGYDLPIILLTGAVGGGGIDIQALQAGADDYITKDLLQGELLDRLIRYAIERRKAEQERQRLMREQMIRDERDARRNEFISMVVHELKTPLSSIKGYSQLLGRRCGRSGDTQGAQLAARLDQQVNRLTSLIDDLQDINRMEGGKLRLRESLFAFDELVAEVVADIQLTTEQQTIVIEGRSGATIYGDRERISQVLTNLLANAIKYAPESETILVKLKRDEQFVTACVQDFGPGIPKEYQEYIFEPFYRVDTPDNGSKQGLGLGLAIAAGLIKRHQGRLWVESEEGAGATFCFTLPLNVPAVLQESEDNESAPTALP
ncbi:MAG TPA: ATP-binding protein [Ktedonobacteraceae bacterium]|nr:ATP-binding protein [Ktedonobacteraceae bacterium]